LLIFVPGIISIVFPAGAAVAFSRRQAGGYAGGGTGHD
jgi:hypothetical protein